MSVIENAIRQQEAAVELTRIYVKNGRVSAAELEVSLAKLDELKGMRLREVAAQALKHTGPIMPENPIAVENARREKASKIINSYPVPKDNYLTMVTVDDQAEYQVQQSQPVQGDVYRRMQELVAQAKGLENQQVLLAEQLRTVPEDQDCPELTEEIAALQGEINATWAEYRFIEQNKKLPEAERIDDDPEREVELLRIAQELKSLRDRRLKLEKKLEKPHLHTKNPAEKVPAWGKELLLIGSQISELEFKREAIR
jgi:hypothetical protein